MNKLYVIGMGPGAAAGMTYEATTALAEVELICGYTVYTELLQPLYPDKEFLSTPMTSEMERCQLALTAAAAGRKVAMVCSGDAGIYGMASPILQMAVNFPTVDVQVISGVTAAASGSALLGAPLSHDFTVISLSDLLSPWDLIEKRLLAAAAADFVIVLYNPASQKRREHLAKACALIGQYQAPETVCGYVQNIGRVGEKAVTTTLAQLAQTTVDMFTTVFIGNSQTQELGGKMVTPRGYIYG